MKTRAGITSLLVNGRPVLLTEALAVAERELMGGFSSSWPLTKVLDIGGVERRPRFSDPSLTSRGELVQVALRERYLL